MSSSVGGATGITESACGARHSLVASPCCEGHRRRARAYNTVFDDTCSMRPGSHAPPTRTDDPVTLVRLILRRMRQRAFVLLGPHQIEHVDVAAAEPTFVKSVGLAIAGLIQWPALTFLTHDPRLL